MGKSRILSDPKSFWVLYTIAGLLFEKRSLSSRDGGTASEATRFGFRVETTAGRWAFLIFWGTLTSWFSAHIIGPVLREIYKEEVRLRDEQN